MVDRIYDNLASVFDTADKEGVDPHTAAMRFAKRRIDAAGGRRHPAGRDRA
jgi:hypothetical protein